MIFKSSFSHSNREFSGSKNKKEERNFLNCISFEFVHVLYKVLYKVPVTVFTLSFSN